MKFFILGTLLYVDSLYVVLGFTGGGGGGGGGLKFDPINFVVYRDPILMIGTLQALGRTVA